MSIQFVDNKEFEYKVPVLIIGAGACGLTAALAAKESGAEIMVLERDKNPYGSTGMSYGGICAAGTELQHSIGIDDKADFLYEDILAVTHQQTDPALAKTIAHNCGPVVDWLVNDYGFNLSVEEKWTGFGHRHPRLHAPPNRSGEELMGMFINAVASVNIDLLTEAHVSDLFATQNGEVLGVRIQRPEGTEELGCDKLILATCGFGANQHMVSRYIPEAKNAKYFGHEGNTGEGILWGMELNAMTADMGAYQALGSLADPQGLVIPHTLMIGGGVQINTRGERFENELENISGQALTILEQPNQICWIVYDERLHKSALSSFADYQEGDEIGAYKVSDSWKGLAELMKIPGEILEATMQNFEQDKSRNSIDDFGRQLNADDKLQAPYYAVKVTGALFHTQGGLCVDQHGRVIKGDNNTLPNLYAGGGTARSVSGPGVWGYLPGMGLCTAVTLGYLAGWHAAQSSVEVRAK